MKSACIAIKGTNVYTCWVGKIFKERKVGKTEHFCSFSFVPVAKKYLDATFSAAKQIDDVLRFEFPSSSKIVGASKASEAEICGFITKSQGILYITHDYSQIDSAHNINQDLAKYLRENSYFGSPKVLRQKRAMLSFLDAVQAFDDHLTDQFSKGPELRTKVRSGISPHALEGKINFIRCVTQHIESSREGYHSDATSGSRVVVSNIPTRFIDHSPKVDTVDGKYNPFSSADVGKVAPKPYEAAIFNTEYTQHGAPPMDNVYREFLLLHRNRSVERPPIFR